MPRIREGTILLEPYKLSCEEIREIIRILTKEKYEYMVLTTKPGYGLTRINNVKMLQTIAPNTIVLDQKTLKHLVEKIPGIKYLVLAKDAWLDTREIPLNDVLRIIDLLEKPREEAKINKYIVKIQKIETSINDYIVLDYVNTPLYWLTPRKHYLENIYKKAVKKMFEEKKKGRIILGYIITNDNEYIPYITITSKKNMKMIETILIEHDDILKRIVFWSLIDVLF